MIILDKNVVCHIILYICIIYFVQEDNIYNVWYDIHVKIFCNLIDVAMCLNRYMDNKFA